MDHRRAVRPPATTRRALFSSTTTRPLHHPRNPNPKSVHIAAESPDPSDDLVERDSAGNYKIMAPTTAMKMGVNGVRSAEDEEKEQEDQMIALYGKQNCHWDQAGK